MVVQNQSRGEKTRREIIQAACELFIHQGYHGTSMRQIAQRAGIALGGVYNHFSGKEEVFNQVFLSFHPYHDVLPALTNVQRLDIEQFARTAFERIMVALEQQPNFLNLMFIEIVEFKGVHAQELFEQLMPLELEIVESILESNRERVRSIPTWMLLRAFFGMLFAYYLTDILFASQAPKEFSRDAPDYLIDIFLNGVLKDK
jgi:AcrR family transcriptional regulator